MHKPGIRGIRGFEQFTRFTLDVAAIPVIQRLSYLPIVADPSHSAGKWYLATRVALAAVAAGAHGLLIEVHPNPGFGEETPNGGGKSPLPFSCSSG